MCFFSERNIVVSRIMESVRVKRDYEIEIDLTLDCKSLGIETPEFAESDQSA